MAEFAFFLNFFIYMLGMVAASLRHLKSLRRLEEDKGWLHSKNRTIFNSLFAKTIHHVFISDLHAVAALLEEAENERMHALLFSQIRQSSAPFRLAVLGAQGIFWNVFFFSYLTSPRLCHKFVAYLEEEAVRSKNDEEDFCVAFSSFAAHSSSSSSSFFLY